MKLYSIFIIYKSTKQNKLPVILAKAMNMGAFMFYTRTTAQETMIFASRTLVDRTCRGKAELLHHVNKDCHAVVLPSGLSCVVITDDSYPSKAAFGLCYKCLNQFSLKQQKEWENEDIDLNLESEWLQKMLLDCQDPKKADVIYKIMSDLQDTQEIMRKNIEDLLYREEKLQHLLQKTQDLSDNSKIFMKKAEEMNRCCYFF